MKEYANPNNRPFTAHIRSGDELVGRLQRVANDLTFNFGQFVLIAEHGPWREEFGACAQMRGLEEITDQQWLVIETLVALHEMHLSKREAA